MRNDALHTNNRHGNAISSLANECKRFIWLLLGMKCARAKERQRERVLAKATVTAATNKNSNIILSHCRDQRGYRKKTTKRRTFKNSHINVRWAIRPRATMRNSSASCRCDRRHIVPRPNRFNENQNDCERVSLLYRPYSSMGKSRAKMLRPSEKKRKTV